MKNGQKKVGNKLLVLSLDTRDKNATKHYENYAGQKKLTRVRLPHGNVPVCLLASWGTSIRLAELLHTYLTKLDPCLEKSSSKNEGRAPHARETATMAAPLRWLSLNFSSSSQFGSHLRRKSTSARNSMTTACFPTPASTSRGGVRQPRGVATSLPGAGTVPESEFYMGTRESQLRLFSSAAAAPLFGDTIIVTKRCAQV